MDFTPFTKINSIETLPQNVKYKTIKLLEDNTGQNLDNFGYSDDFSDITSKAPFIKGRINKLNFIKIKTLLLCERHYQENEKTNHRLGENIYQRHI